jgi:hypothetical protein
MNFNFERLVVDQEPCHVLFSSEIYPVLLKTGMTVSADVIVKKGKVKHERSLIIAPLSLAKPLTLLMEGNGGRLTGIEVWIYKSGPEKTSSYIVEE